MVCKINVGMQGRIDATRLFNTNLFRILTQKAGMMRLLWDKQMAVYHHGPHERSSASLSDILLSIKTATDSPPQQDPIGYAVIGWHVDDGTGVACCVGWNLDYKTNRVVQFIKGKIEVTYAVTMTGWHGNKALGFTLFEDERKHKVTMTAMDAIKKLSTTLLRNAHVIAPKHVMTVDFDDIPSGVVPDKGDPQYNTVMTEMSETRHGLGVMIWASQAHISAMHPTNKLCARMQYPHGRTRKGLCHMLMHLLAHDPGSSWGGDPTHFGLEMVHDDKHVSPYVSRPMHMMWFGDANLSLESRTGGVGMLARGCIFAISQRQHLSAPDAHTSEVVSGGTNFSMLVPVAGVCQELHVLCGDAVPFYLDSKTTVFVATSDTAAKKSVWLLRRVAVLEDGVQHGDMSPRHISERDQAADPFTKYLTQPVWARHMHFVLNKDGDVPPYPGRN